jgi:hypothetical protein
LELAATFVDKPAVVREWVQYHNDFSRQLSMKQLQVFKQTRPFHPNDSINEKIPLPNFLSGRYLLFC